MTEPQRYQMSILWGLTAPYALGIQRNKIKILLRWRDKYAIIEA